jgi:hypothetical protein
VVGEIWGEDVGWNSGHDGFRSGDRLLVTMNREGYLLKAEATLLVCCGNFESVLRGVIRNPR